MIQNRCEEEYMTKRSTDRVNLSAVLQVISQIWWHLHDFRKKKCLVTSQNAFLFCWPSLSMYVYAQVSIK